jgi:hypothetical protein
MARMGSFRGSPLFKMDILTAHEPGIPGGETPPSTAGETPAATEARFMGRGGRLGVEAETQGTVNLWQSSGSREG